MKTRYLLSLVALLSAAWSCSFDSDSFNGSNSGENGGKYYMLSIADDLVVDKLNDLEVWMWTGKVPAAVEGGTKNIEKLDDGDYLVNGNEKCSMGGNSFDTQYTIRAHPVTEVSNHHYNWDVTVSGTRIERDGYMGEFWSDGELSYITDGSLNWDTCKGILYLKVYRKGEKIDLSALELNGTKEQIRYTRGL